MKLTIEQKLQKALLKNPITRERLFLKILKSSVIKCVYILLRRNRKYIRMYSIDDLIQESEITILKILRDNLLNNIQCQIRTYILGAVKRKVYSIIREEYALKRMAQTGAYPLDKIENDKKNLKGTLRNSPHLQIKRNLIPIDDELEIKDIMDRVVQKLKYPANDIFQLLVNGYPIRSIAYILKMPLQSVYTILRRKIRPAVYKFLRSE